MFAAPFYEHDPTESPLAHVDELRAVSYLKGDEEREKRDGKAGAAEGGRVSDGRGAGREGSGVQRGSEEERGAVGGEARAERPAESLLGQTGTEAERKSALTEYFAQAINDAYAAGEIDTAQYRALRNRNGARGAWRGYPPKTETLPDVWGWV